MAYKKYKNVRALQKFLKKEGYDPGSVDNNWGPNTEKAFKLYMSQNPQYDGVSVDPISGAYNLLPLPLRSFIEDIGVSQFNKISPIDIQQDALTEKDLNSRQMGSLRDIVRKKLDNGETSISYSDYGTNTSDSYEDVSGRASNADIASKGFFDPSYQLKTTLGQADIFTTPTDTFVVDQGYNFNDGQGKSIFNPYAWKDAAYEIGSNPSLYTVPRKLGKQFGSVEDEGRGALIKTTEYKNGGQVRRYKHGGSHDTDLEKVKKGLRYVESSNGLQMTNPKSSATGFYGQLYNAEELQYMSYLDGVDRQSFASDTTLQNKLFEDRYYGNIPKVPGLKGNAEDLRIEYQPQLAKKGIPFNYTDDEISALSNLLGRQGTREYLGYVLRDSRSLADVFPKIYGPDPEAPNKTPEKYLESYRKGRDLKYGGQVRSYAGGGLYNFSTIEPTTNIGNWAGDNGTNFAPQSPAPAPVSGRGGDLSKSEGHVTEMQGWYGDYINSPTYRERLERSGDYGSPEDMDEVTRLRYEALQDVTVGNDTNASHMNTETSGMQLKPGDEEREGIIAHEVGHTVGGIYDDSTHEKPFSERSDHDKKSLSVNDIKSIEDRNTVYQNAPYIPVGDENITGLNFIGGADTQYTSGDDIVTDRGTPDTNRGSVRRGTPSIEANQLSPTHYLGQEVPFATNTDVSRDPQDYDSTEEYVRANYSFPEGYEESSKEVEITRLVEAIDGNTSRDTRILKARKEYGTAKKDVRNLTDREDLNEDLAIQFQVDSDLEYAQEYAVGSKSLKKKYRGMSLDEIPDGVDPDVDAYRKSLAAQNALHAAKKTHNDEKNSPRGDTHPRPYTPEGGNEAVIKRGGLHEIGASENYSDIVGMRKLLYDKYGKTPEEEVTLEEYNTLLKEYKKPTKGTNVSVPGRYSEQHTPEDAVWLLNNIAMEPTQDEGVTSAKYGGNMKKYNNNIPQAGFGDMFKKLGKQITAGGAGIIEGVSGGLLPATKLLSDSHRDAYGAEAQMGSRFGTALGILGGAGAFSGASAGAAVPGAGFSSVPGANSFNAIHGGGINPALMNPALAGSSASASAAGANNLLNMGNNFGTGELGSGMFNMFQQEHDNNFEGYAMGGTATNMKQNMGQDINVESGELLMSASGGQFQSMNPKAPMQEVMPGVSLVKGNQSNDNVPIKIPDGETMVFSKRLGYADKGLELVEQYKSIKSSPDSNDFISQQTKTFQLKKINEKLQALFKEQESSKSKKINKQTGVGEIPGAFLGDLFQKGKDFVKSDSFKDFGNKALTFAKDNPEALYNVGMGMFGKDPQQYNAEDYQTQYSPDPAMTNIDTGALLAPINNQVNASRYAINQSGASPSEIIAANMAVGAKAGPQLAAAEAKGQMLQNQMNLGVYDKTFKADSANNMIDFKTRMMNDKMSAVRPSFFKEATSSLGKYSSGKNAEDMMRDMYNQRFGNMPTQSQGQGQGQGFNFSLGNMSQPSLGNTSLLGNFSGLNMYDDE